MFPCSSITFSRRTGVAWGILDQYRVSRTLYQLVGGRAFQSGLDSGWEAVAKLVGEIGKNATGLIHGFESSREGPKEVRSSLRRQSFSSDSKREVIAPALGRTRRGFAPAREATSGSGESHAGSRRRRGDCSPAGQGPPAFLPVGGAHHRPPFPNQEGVEGRLPRPGDRRLGPHSSASPAGQRQKPGCAWLRGVPCSAAFCTLACSRSARLLETWPTNPLPSTINTF